MLSSNLRLLLLSPSSQGIGISEAQSHPQGQPPPPTHTHLPLRGKGKVATPASCLKETRPSGQVPGKSCLSLTARIHIFSMPPFAFVPPSQPAQRFYRKRICYHITTCLLLHLRARPAFTALSTLLPSFQWVQTPFK